MVAPSPSSGFSRITLWAPTTRADVAVPSAIPVVSFLPGLLDRVDEDAGAATPGHGGWRLCRVDGTSLDLGRSMDANDVRDGDVLLLQPARAVIDDPLFDDVVEIVGRDGVGGRWTARERRIASGVLGVLAATVALAALLALPRHGLLTAGIAIAAAVLLLLGAFAVSRAAGELVGGGLLAAAAGPFGAAGAALCLDGPWGRERELLASAALLVVVATVPGIVGGFEAVSGAFAVIGLFGALGGIVAVGADVHATRSVALVAPLALAVTTVLPPLALRLARLPRPTLALTAPELAELPGEVDQARTAARVAAARALLTGLTAGALGVVAAGCVVLAASANAWSHALAAVLIALMLLRSRLYAARAPVVAAIAAVLIAVIGSAVVLVAAGDEPRLVALAAAGGVLALVALGVGTTAGRWQASPRQRRLVDAFETLLLVSVPPLVLGVWRVYDTIFHLGD